ncbi:MAG: hypothetical protein CML81_08390 [Rhodobiaceae bacterium]|nr:hypothetical protein [Rhodobiaceae bacterium]RPF95369.1 MAG: hypothetical protein CBD87_008335 [Rhizobiales bacterium TMED227]|tara:strand:- start:5669 stop:7156 length:1488 start_codon:yes stop_codon:yes gene_type:complete
MPAPKKKVKRQSQELDITTGLSRSVGQGLLFGFADEAEAFVRSLAGDKGYEENLETIRSELDAFREQAPVAAYGSEALASIPSALLGGAGLARLGLTGAGKIGAIEGALYGAGTGESAEERLTGAALGATLGGGVSKAAEKLLPQKSKIAKKLQEKGIPLTPGQSLRDQGSIGSSLITALEDLTTSYPGAGAVIQGKRLEGLIKTNQVFINEAVQPLNIKIPKNLTPRESFEFVQDRLDEEYAKILPKLSISDLGNFENKILNTIEDSILDPKEQERVLKIVNKTILTQIKDGKISGNLLKNAQTDLRKLSSSYKKRGGFEGDVGEVLSNIKRLLENEIDLQNPNSDQLKKINQVYKNMIPINRAMENAIVNEGIFTPAQLLRAVKKQDETLRKRQTIAGKQPLQETAEQAQQILGSQFPETGTASRLLAQDIIIDPTKLVTLGPPAILSELAMARIGGMSPTTGLLTSADPVVRGLSPFFGSQLSQVPINETEE